MPGRRGRFMRRGVDDQADTFARDVGMVDGVVGSIDGCSGVRSAECGVHSQGDVPGRPASGRRFAAMVPA